MSNYYEKTSIQPSKFVGVSSRYAESEVVYYTENKLLTFKTYKKNSYTPSANDKYTVITKGYEYRPDLLSNQAYGTPDFWWKILEVNGMKDIFEFRSGENIVIPNNILF
jgi:hypothetical protein